MAYNKTLTGAGWVVDPIPPISSLLARTTLGAQFIEVEPSGTGGGGTGSTSYLKVEAEAPFSRFRVWVRSNNPVLNDGYIASGAVTEDPGYTTVAQLTTPVVGGVSYNNVRSAVNANKHGFRQVAFSASGGVIPAAVALADDPTRVAPNAIASDWIDVASVPPTSGTRPFALVRVAKTTGSNGTTTFPNGTRETQWHAAKVAGLDFARLNFHMSAGVDGVGTPANVPGGVAMQGAFWVGVEFDYITPAKNILTVGDSITASGGYQAYGFDNWIIRAAFAASTPTAPIGVFSAGISAVKMATSVQQTSLLLAQGLKPSIFLLPNFSINNAVSLNSTNPYHAGQCKAAAMEVIDRARALNAKVIMWTNYHHQNVPGGSEAQLTLLAQNQ